MHKGSPKKQGHRWHAWVLSKLLHWRRGVTVFSLISVLGLVLFVLYTIRSPPSSVPCDTFDCCVEQGNIVIQKPPRPDKCVDAATQKEFLNCAGEEVVWSTPACWKDPRNVQQVFERNVQQRIANNTLVLDKLKQEQSQQVHHLRHQQDAELEWVNREFSLATQALKDEAMRLEQQQRSANNDNAEADTVHPVEPGHDTWSFMIPVIKTNPRRQKRLVRNLCNLNWPPKALMGVYYLVDEKSRLLVEETKTVLEQCGVTQIKLYNDPPQEYSQPIDAAGRHSMEAQLTRRIAIAKARNFLLHKALLPRHTSVVWIDSDLLSFPADILARLQRTGG